MHISQWLGGRVVRSLDSYAMTAVWQGKQRGLKRLALDRDVAAGAVCHEGHWTLIIMYLKEMRSLYLDPYCATQQQIERCKHVTRALVRQKCPAIGRWTCATLAHPRQQDTTSCGVFVCKLAEQILLAQQIDYAVDQEGVAMLRMDMAKALLANTDDLSQLCRACGEESSGAEMDEWIECTTCCLWYHSVCWTALTRAGLALHCMRHMNRHCGFYSTAPLSDNYLSKHIQNELISLVAKCTIDAIVEKVKKAKYYAVTMDCTPDLSHNEQLSVVLRIVNCETSKGISIHEHFVGFLQALDTTGKGLCESFLGHLETLGLDLSNCRGQSYDNGSNMQGKKQGVQKRVLELNSKALCVPCGSHTLKLVVGDAAKSSVTSISFFGLLQRLYTLFSSSVHRWSILTEHVKNFTLKALSTTRWESRVEAIKAVRYQLPEIVEALTALKEYAMEKRDAEVVSTAGSICKEMQRWPFVHHNIEDSSCCCPNLSCVKRAPCLPLPWAPNFLNLPLGGENPLLAHFWGR
ncbi:uncharacterized protein LOC125904267 isoform X2 [Epinephelus fuscoguttatus]|uniref:uncharacterized protein LOC125904267 isoform X2 n=1 Tax=Epinephelus fuscoguttatus TaxID=293821 RepID=UPI0020CFF681|nr:uncharacterized protein LOC125904267 isoform X2 [Epinephelus fuscoguttatus]